MKTKFLFPILVLVGLLMGCKSIKEPEFRRLENFKVNKVGLQKAQISLGITYYNPNKFGVTAKEADIMVYVDSIFLGRFTQDSAIAVQSFAEFSVPITGDIAIENFLKFNVRNLVDKPIMIRADGKIKVGKSGFYITKAIHYEGSHNLSELKLQ